MQGVRYRSRGCGIPEVGYPGGRVQVQGVWYRSRGDIQGIWRGKDIGPEGGV